MTNTYKGCGDLFGTLVDDAVAWCRGGGFRSADVTWPHLTVAKLVLLWDLRPDPRNSLSDRCDCQPSEVQLAFEGAIGIWAGLVTLRTPVTTAMVLIFFIWVWAVVTGILRIFEAIRLRKEITGELWLALSGVALIRFAFMVRLRPVLGTFDLAWFIGASVLLFVCSKSCLGRKLRSMQSVL